MLAQDYILLIMNCKKYALKALYQKKTWLPSIPSYLIYYHVIGDEELEEDFVFDNENRILWVKTPDDYNSLPNKVISAYKAVERTFYFRFVFKTDDDQILVNNKFFNMVCGLIDKNKIPRPQYGGYIVNVDQPYLCEYYKIHPELPRDMILQKTQYCSGRFYFLSAEAINYLIKKEDLIKKEYLEDYAIGYYLHPYFKTNMLSLATNRFFTDIEKSDFPQFVENIQQSK